MSPETSPTTSVAALERAALMAPFFVAVVGCAVIDARRRIVPHRIVLPCLAGFAAAVAILDAANGAVSAAKAAVGCLTFGGGLLLVALLSPEAMGLGDVKLGALIGLVLGSLGLEYVAVAAGTTSLAGGLGATAVLLVRRRRGSSMPFAPFLAIGAILSAVLTPRFDTWFSTLPR